MSFVNMVSGRLLERAADRDAEGSPAAGIYRRVASDMIQWWHEYQTTPLDMPTAIEESGYSEQGLRRYMRRHELKHLTRATLPTRPMECEDERTPLTQVPLTVTVEDVRKAVAARFLPPPKRRRKPVKGPDASPLVDAMFEG